MKEIRKEIEGTMKLYKIVVAKGDSLGRMVDIVWAENRKDAMLVIPFTNTSGYMAVEIKTMKPELTGGKL
jgi:hypothetical protein